MLLAVALLWVSQSWAQPTTQPSTQPGEAAAGEFDHSHSAWTTLLSTYVSEDGTQVNYSGLQENAEHVALLDSYLASLATADPSGWSREDRYAFWLNAYNACVWKGVLENWPIESVYPVPGFFDRTEYRLAGEDYTLNRIEEEQLRQPFLRDGLTDHRHDPRFHFAINCAAASCPPLRQEAYQGSILNDQLQDQARQFIRATTRVDPDNRAIHVSKLFEWYNPDFHGTTGGHRAIIRNFVHDTDRRHVEATVNFFHFDEFDWSINGN